MGQWIGLSVPDGAGSMDLGVLQVAARAAPFTDSTSDKRHSVFYMG
jgi:hypothetical protein